MTILTLALVLALVLSVIVRRLGCSKLFAVVIALIPALVTFIFFLVRRDIEIGPHGGIISARIAAVVVLMLSAIVSAVTVHFVPAA